MISARQLTLIVALTRVAALLVLLPVVQIGEARQDAWISVIVSTLAACLLAGMSASLAAKYPGKSLGHYANQLLGRLFGTIATGLVALSFYVLCLIRIRLVSLVIITEFMPKTPGWGLAIPMLLTAFYGAMLGPDSIGRSSELLFTLVMTFILTGFLLVYTARTGPVIGLKPILSRGLRPVLAASISPTFLGAASGSKVLALGRFTTKTRGLVKAVLAGLVISGLVRLVMTILVLTTLGPEQAQRSVTPVLALASAVYIEGLLERLDLFLLAAWVLGVSFDVTALLMSSSILIGDSLGVSFRTVAAVLFVAGIIPVSHRFTDVFIVNELHSIPVTAVWTLAVYVGAVGSLYLAALIKRLGKRT